MHPALKPSLLIGIIVLAHGSTVIAGEDPGAPTVDSLLSRFAAVPGLEARFREEKRIAILAAPIVSEGTIHFAPPARLVRKTVTPQSSTLLINGETLLIGDGEDVEEIDLQANPVVRDYVVSFLKLLEGDRETLERIWRMEVASRDKEWELTLWPLSESIKGILHSMVFRGHGAVVEWMMVVETNGDETVTSFFDIDATRHYSEAELNRLFQVTPR